MLRLYTFQVSHFAEKARWALDYKRAPYEERRLLPGPHLAVTRRLGKTTTVPLLVADGQVVQGSSAIIDFADERWPDRPLSPRGDAERQRALELESWLDKELGEPLRRVFYFHALAHPDLVLWLFTQGGPWWGRLFYSLGFDFVAGRIRATYAITAENAAKDRERLAAVFEKVGALLTASPYLAGDRFCRADLTLAALAAPMWDPPEHPTRWPPRDLYPPELAALRAAFDGSPAREHVLRVYQEMRRTPPP